MTLQLLCALTPPMCRMAADPAVRNALHLLSDHPEADLSPLADAMARHSSDAAHAMALLGSTAPLAARSLRDCFSREALAFFHLCGQCTAGEILSVLINCTIAPTADALALLIGERRRQHALQQYALQLLWRMQSDPSLPGPSAFFAPASPERTADQVICSTIHRLKEAET